MKKYISLLRGVNVGGKNRVPMAELKKGFEALGFGEVKTYLNSGNVVFSGSGGNTEAMANRIKAMIKEQFGLEIPVFLLAQESLVDILRHAPGWWGGENREIYDNLIFILPPVSFDEISAGIGEPKEPLERVENYREAVFWSFSRRDYQKTNWWPGTASAAVGKKLTIRTANTVRKLAEM